MNLAPKTTGVLLTVCFHAALLFVCVKSGLKYVYPPPVEKSMVIQFEPDPEPVAVQVKAGVQPRSENPDPVSPVRLVQRSEASVTGTKANEAEESTVGADGDVEVPEPPRREIDRRALFTSAANNRKDTLSPQTSSTPSDKLKAGHASGNAADGTTEGEPSARLKGRSLLGSLPLPDYQISESGRVVVAIKVDRNGSVVYANPGVAGTTTTNARLREAAKRAALKAKFNVNQSAPELQEGTITYIFRLD